MPDLDPIYGTYALPPANERWRGKAQSFSNNKWGRTMISMYRKRALAGVSEPIDVEIAPDVKARLYPSENRCEKRAFAGVQIWDTEERAALEASVRNSAHRAYVFLDVGANVGLYSLFVNAYVKAAERPCQIIAIEPGLETCSRLEANIKASGAKVQIVRAAISDVPGTGHLNSGSGNRGEARLVAGGQNVEAVVIDTLTRICRTQGLQHIDAMKVDIEGHDLRALIGFFEDAPERLHPELLILETGHDDASPLLDLCQAQGYKVVKRTGLNSILEKNSHVQT